MRKQPYPILELTGGIDKSLDPVYLVDKSYPNLRGARFDKGLIRKDLGWSDFGVVSSSGLPLEGTVMLIDIFYLQGGSEYLIAVTPKWAYRYVSTSDTYTKIGAQVTSGLVDLAFVLATMKIIRAIGDWTTDGFTVNTIITINSTLNPGPFVITNCGTSELVVTGTMVNETVEGRTVTGTVPFTGDEDNQFCSATTLDVSGNDIFVLTNGVDPIRKWTGTGYLTSLGGLTTIKAKLVVPFMNRLILLHTIESGTACPRRVRWSCAGNPEDYTSTGSGFVELTDTVDWITGYTIIKGKLFIIKERSIWELVYVGGTTYFEAQLRLDGVGSYSQQGNAALGEESVIYGSDNVYLYDGLDLTPIGSQIVPLLYETGEKVVNFEKINRSCSVYVEELSEYWLCVPTVGEVPDLLFKYNFTSQSWILRDISITAFGYYTVPAGVTWNDLSGTWAAQTWLWLEKALPSGAPTTLFGLSTGYIKEDDRLTKSTDTMIWETKDWTFGHASRIVEIRVQAKGGPFTIWHSLDGGTTWLGGETFAAQTAFKEFVYHINVTTQHIRAKIVTTAEDFDIKWIEPWYIQRVRSKSLTTS